MKTVEQIYGRTQDLLKFNSDSIQIPGLEEDRTLDWINDLQERFVQEFYDRGLVAPSEYRSETGFDAISSNTLDGDIASGATTIDLNDATDFTSGAGVIINGNQWDIFYYTGKSSNQLTGVTGINYAHSDKEEVTPLYTLPADFGRVRPGKRRGDGVIVGGLPYYEVAENPITNQFAIVDDAYLWLPCNSGAIQCIYDRKTTDVISTADDVDIKAPHDQYLIHGLIGIYKQVEDQDYFPEKEERQMQLIVNSAMKKRTAGKRLQAGGAYFNRGSNSYFNRW